MKLNNIKNAGSLRVLVVSANGMGNVGDDIVGQVAAAIFEQSTRARVRSVGPPYSRADIEWADVVVLGGGGLLYDWSVENVDNYLNFIEHAAYMGKKTIALGMGTQGIYTEYGKRRYREVLSNMADLITVRDEKDAAVLADEVGVRRPMHVAHDLAFLLPQYYDQLSKRTSKHARQELERLERLKQNGRPLVGIGLAAYMWTDEFMSGLPPAERDRRKGVYRACIEQTRQLAQQNEVVLLLHSKDDQAFYQEIQQGAEHISMLDLTDNSTDAAAMFDAYRQLDMALVSRYHGLILALLAHKPVSVLGTQEKIVKSIQSTLPSFAGSLFDDTQIEQFFGTVSGLDKKTKFTPAQMDELNASIIKANKNIELVASFLYPFRT